MAVALTRTLTTSLLMVSIALHLSLTAERNQVCSDPKTVKNTKKNQYSGSYKVREHLRYICEDGYKRQAGTSNLAICLLDDKTKKAAWKYGNIACIRDPLIPVTTPSNIISPFTASASSSSPTVERFTTMSSTPTVKLPETPHSTQGKVTQTSQIPAHTTMTRLPTVTHHVAPGITQSPGLQFTQTLLPKKTVNSVTAQTTVSTSTEVTITESTDVPETVKQSTTTHFKIPVQTTNVIDDNQKSSWQKTETIAVVGSIVVIIPLIGLIILILYCKKRRQGTSRPMETQIPLRNTNSEDNAPTSDPSNKDSEEESIL